MPKLFYLFVLSTTRQWKNKSVTFDWVENKRRGSWKVKRHNIHTTLTIHKALLSTLPYLVLVTLWGNLTVIPILQMRNKLNTEKEGKQLVQLHNTDKMKPEGFFCLINLTFYWFLYPHLSLLCQKKSLCKIWE